MISDKQQAIRRNGFAPVILIVVLALVIAVGGIGIGLAWRTNYLDKYLPAKVKELLGKEVKPGDRVSDQGEQPGEEPKSEEDKTKDWKIYISEKYGYSVRYPKDWYHNVGDQGDFLVPDDTANFQATTESLARDIWTYVQDSQGLSAKDFALDLTKHSDPVVVGEVSIGGIKGFQVYTIQEPPYPKDLPWARFTTSVVVKGRRAYIFVAAWDFNFDTGALDNTYRNSTRIKEVYELMLLSVSLGG